DFALAEEAYRCLSDGILTNFLRSLPGDGMIEAHTPDGVVSEVCTEGIFRFKPAEAAQTTMRNLTARDPASILLFELVPVDRVIQVVGEIRKQIESIAHGIGCHARARSGSGPLSVRCQAVSKCASMIRRIERSEL